MIERGLTILLAAILLSGCNSRSSVEFRVSGTVKTAQIKHFQSGYVYNRSVVTLPHVYRTQASPSSTESFAVQSPMEKGNLELKVFVDGKLVSSDYASTPQQDINIKVRLPHTLEGAIWELFGLMAFCAPVAWWLVHAISRSTEPKLSDSGKERQVLALDRAGLEKENPKSRYLARVRDAIRRTE